MTLKCSYIFQSLLISLVFTQRLSFPQSFDGIPPGVETSDQLLQIGFLDVTKKPYFADPSGQSDSTAAIQKAVNDARDFRYACFFPSGTYLISDTISCEQALYKLDAPKKADGKVQNYWGSRNLPCILIGSRKGSRPVLRLNPESKKFQDKNNPRPLVWVWAQTRDNVPGTDEPAWGTEQPNISFNQIFQGIDIDVSGHPGAVGIRHAGSQGSTLEDVRIHAEGAFSGIWNCPGQGGGTYNVEIIGGDYGVWLDQAARFPMLAGLLCRGQKKAFVYHAGLVTPLMMAGFFFEGDPECAVSLVDNKAGAGTTLVDGIIKFSGKGRPVFETTQDENLVLKNVYVSNAVEVVRGERIPAKDSGSLIQCFARRNGSSRFWYGGQLTNKTRFEIVGADSAPVWEHIRKKHVWDAETFPFFEDEDAVNIKDLGARGDGVSDDTAVFKKAIGEHAKIFVPRGTYIVSDTLTLEKNTALFGVARIVSNIQAKDGWGRENTPIITTVDDRDATTCLAGLSVNHTDRAMHLSLIHWQAGRDSVVRNIYSDLVETDQKLKGGRMVFDWFISGSGGGRWYAVNCREGGYTRKSGHPGYRRLMVQGTTEPLAFYAMNTERITSDYQAEIQKSGGVSFYYYKAEASQIGTNNTQTPVVKICGSDNVSIYCMSGVLKMCDRGSLVTVEDSASVTVTCVRSFRPDAKYSLITVDGMELISGDSTCAYFSNE